MSRHRIRLALAVAVGVAMTALAVASAAQAAGVLGSGIGPTVGPDLNPLPSIEELLDGVVNGLFGALLSALTPSFLRHADTQTLEWLVALPNPADTSLWPNVGRLEANMVWVAGAMLPTTLIIATTRDSALSLTFRAHPGNALLRVIGAVFFLVLYRWAFENGVAFVNVLTHTMLSWPIVAQGLHRTVLVMFGSSAIFGAGGAFLGLLGLVALVLAVCLFALKVLVLTVIAILFVCGPLFIALTPLPTVGHLAQGWLLALVGICLIPVGWCVIFATAGALGLDVTNLGGGAHIGSRVVGAFAALVTFYVAFKWPLMVVGHVRGALGGLGVRLGGISGSGAVASDGALAAKAQRARTGLQAAMLTGGRGLGLAAGQLGAPRGGLVGVAARQLRADGSVPTAGAASAAQRPVPTSAPARVARARDQLRRTPKRMREAWRAAGESGPPADSGRRDPRADWRARRPGRRSAGGGSQRSPEAGGARPMRPDGRAGDRARAARQGSAGPPRAPVVPPAGPQRAGNDAPRGPSPGRASESGSGAARRQASAPAQPQRSGGAPARSSRPAPSRRSSDPRSQPASDPRPAQPPVPQRRQDRSPAPSSPPTEPKRRKP